MKISRREALIGLGVIGIVGFGTYSKVYLHNGQLKRLKPKNGKIPADLHVHLNKDCDPIKVREVLSQPGLVGLTRYHVPNNLLSYQEIKNYPEFEEIKGEEGILGKLTYNGSSGYVLNCQEITNFKHHISALGCKDTITASSLEDVVKEIHEQGGIAILNHPYVVPSGKWWPPWEAKYRPINEEEKRINEILVELVDEVEVFNGQCINLLPGIINMNPANEMAKKFAEDHGFKGIATSDAHGREYGQILTSGIYIPDQDLTFKRLKQYIKNQEFEAVGNYIPGNSFIRGHFPKLENWI